MKSPTPHVVVVGSINMDLVARVAQLPRSGESVLATDFFRAPGGKGANQAVAVARLGGFATLVARVGDDVFAYELVDALSSAGVDTSAVLTTRDCSSGLALISVDDCGENCITAVSGANARLSPQDVLDQESLIASADVLLVQLELSIETVAAAVDLARRHNVFTILDPAPAPVKQLPRSLQQVGVLTPNQTEAERLTGLPVTDLDRAAEAAVDLRRRGAKSVIITLGIDGAMACNKEGCTHISAPSVDELDSTAAGDAFAAAVAVRLASGDGFIDAVRFGCAAGALATTKLGAQASVPTHTQVNLLLRESAVTAWAS
jgi:ribokinase